MKMSWLLFVIGAAVCWGAYVPAIHHGQLGFAAAPNRALRVFLFVGLAYFLLAVLVPGVLLKVAPDGGGFAAPTGGFATKGATIATIAGVLGALGALCVIFALRAGGNPIVVAPLVFGAAPLVNVVVASLWDKPKDWPHVLFFVGLALVAVGAGLVLGFKPA